MDRAQGWEQAGDSDRFIQWQAEMKLCTERTGYILK